MASNDLLIRISGDTKGFAAAMASVNGQLVQSQRQVETTARSFTGMGSVLAKLGPTMAGVFSAGALTAFVQGAVQARAQMDSLERGLTAVMGSGQRATVELEKLKEVAKLPGLGFQEAVRGSINLQAAGFNADTARRALQGFGNALATVGKGKVELDGVITALTQIAAKGKVSAEEINQLAERVPQIREIMRGAFGTANTEELQKMGISAQQFIEKVINELERLPKVTGGLQNDLENFSDQWTELMSRMGKIVQPAVSFTLEWLSKLSKGITDAFSNWDELMRLYDKIEQREAAVAGISKRQSFLGLGDFGGKSLDDAKAYLDMVKKIQELEEKTSKARGDRGSSGWNTGISVTGFKPTMAPAASRIHINIIDDTAKALKKQGEEASKTAAAHKELSTAMQGPIMLTDALQAEIAKLKQADYDAYFRDLAKAMYDISNGAKTASIETARYNRILEMMKPRGMIFEPDVQLPGRTLEDDAKAAESALGGLQTQYGDVATAALGSGQKQSAAMREVSTVFTDMSRDIAKLVMDGGKLKDVFIGAARSMAEAMLRLVIQGAFKQLGEAIMDNIGKLSSLGKVFGAIFGGSGGGVPGMSAPAITGISNIPNVGAPSSGVGSAVGAGVTGIVGAIGGVVSAVSGVIGNFQMQGMNKSLDLIEKETRYSQIHLLNILEKLNKHIPGIDDINKRLNEAGVNGYRVYTTDNQLAVAMAGAAGGGGGFTTNINFSGNWIGFRDMDALIAEIARKLKSMGV